MNLLITIFGGMLLTVVLYGGGRALRLSNFWAAVLACALPSFAYVAYAAAVWPGLDVVTIHVVAYPTVAVLLYQLYGNKAGHELNVHWAPKLMIIFFVLITVIFGGFVYIAGQGLPPALARLILPGAKDKNIHTGFAGVVASAARQLAPEAKLAYVMTDGAALPYALSDLMHQLTGEGIVDHTLSAGHAFGAEVETVTVASALGIAANELGADLIVVAMGPGVVGTGSRLGTTAIEVAHVLADVSLAAGLPILAPRVSGAEPRARHQGISHHTVTAAHRSRTRPLCPDLSDLGVDMTNLSPHVDLAAVAAAGGARVAKDRKSVV